jgi:nitroreductase
MAPDKCRPVNADQIPEPENFELFLQNRRSIRRFKFRVPDRKLLQKMIAMAGHAPSGHNQQPVKWLVYDDSKKISHMAGLAVDWMKHVMETTPGSPQAGVFKKIVQAWENDTDLIFHHAPCLVIGHSRIITGTEPIDTVAALAYMDLASLTMGFGCCWAGIFLMALKVWKPLASYLSLPAGHKVHGAMMVGYPKFNFKRAPLRNPPDINWAGSDPALMKA